MINPRKNQRCTARFSSVAALPFQFLSYCWAFYNPIDGVYPVEGLTLEAMNKACPTSRKAIPMVTSGAIRRRSGLSVDPKPTGGTSPEKSGTISSSCFARKKKKAKSLEIAEQ